MILVPILPDSFWRNQYKIVSLTNDFNTYLHYRAAFMGYMLILWLSHTVHRLRHQQFPIVSEFESKWELCSLVLSSGSFISKSYFLFFGDIARYYARKWKMVMLVGIWLVLLDPFSVLALFLNPKNVPEVFSMVSLISDFYLVWPMINTRIRLKSRIKE